MKDVRGYEGRYAVTETGEVWSYPKRVPVGRNGGFRSDPMRRLKAQPFLRHTEHLRVYLASNGFKTPHQVHRLVALAFLPNPLELPCVNHIDGDPTNNHVSNLEWCTVQKNSKHAYRAGLIKVPTQQGSANSQSKLTPDMVRAIRARHADIRNCSAIARELGLHVSTIHDIVRRKLWAHLD